MRTFRLLPLRLVLLSCAIGLGGVLLCASQAVASKSAPTIDGTSVTNITEHGATLELRINPHGVKTHYEFAMVEQGLPPNRGPFTGSSGAHQTGEIAASSEDATLSFALTGLLPGYYYWYQVHLCSRGGAAEGEYWFGFHNSGIMPEYWNKPIGEYVAVVSCGSTIRSEEISEKAIKEYEERLAAKRLAEQHETEAKTTAEAAERRRAEQQAAQSLPACAVPSLKGNSLNAARRAIARHHCRLGKVGWPRHHHGTLVVTGQNPKRGKRLPNGAAIALTLGPRRRG